MSAQEQLSLRSLYSRALKAASKASSMPSIEVETQENINSARADLQMLWSRVGSLNLFSPNESIEEVATKDLLFMTVPFILAEVESNTRTTNRDERMASLKKAQLYLRSFISLLEAYNVVPEDEKKLYGKSNSNITDMAKRREVKIAQFKKEKEIKNKIAAFRARRGLPELDMTNTYDLVESILPGSIMDEEDEDEDVMRDSIVLLLRLQWAQTSAQLNSIDQELELLLNAPPEEPKDPSGARSGSDDTWKLDTPLRGSLMNQQGPLIDVNGRPLRPFTILPAGAGERARLQSEVFRPDHRLPSMSIDQYLEEEQRRGNIISGGGPQSASAPTRKEQLAIDAEMDGTIEGEGKAEEKRQEDERWAQYTDANPRGAGNTMNRG